MVPSGATKYLFPCEHIPSSWTPVEQPFISVPVSLFSAHEPQCCCHLSFFLWVYSLPKSPSGAVIYLLPCESILCLWAPMVLQPTSFHMSPFSAHEALWCSNLPPSLWAHSLPISPNDTPTYLLPYEPIPYIWTPVVFQPTSFPVSPFSAYKPQCVPTYLLPCEPILCLQAPVVLQPTSFHMSPFSVYEPQWYANPPPSLWAHSLDVGPSGVSTYLLPFEPIPYIWAPVVCQPTSFPVSPFPTYEPQRCANLPLPCEPIPYIWAPVVCQPTSFPVSPFPACWAVQWVNIWQPGTESLDHSPLGVLVFLLHRCCLSREGHSLIGCHGMCDGSHHSRPLSELTETNKMPITI